jgi:LPS-assembly lipoprotein
MSWSKPFAVAAACLTVAACGFQPMYGSAAYGGADVADKMTAVEIANIPERPGQKLRNALVDRMHASGATTAAYRLEVRYTAAEQKIAVAKDASAERYQLVFRAPYRLVEKASGKVLLDAVARTNVVYDSLEEQFGLLASRENGYDRAVTEVSEEITLRVAAALGRGK